jgi:hypothetical protein
VNKGKEKDGPSSGNGQGWVLVNVEGRKSPSLADVPASPVLKDSKKSESVKPGSPTPGPVPQASISPAAKAIVIIDAVENKGGNGGWKTKNGNKEDGGKSGATSRVRKLFTLARKNSVSGLVFGVTAVLKQEERKRHQNRKASMMTRQIIGVGCFVTKSRE